MLVKVAIPFARLGLCFPTRRLCSGVVILRSSFGALENGCDANVFISPKDLKLLV